MAVDIGAGHQLSVNHYCLRQDCNIHFLRNWEFQGSNDNTTWVMLRKHVGDEGLNGKAYAVAHWPVEGKEAATPFRYFRLLQNGKCSNGYDHLMCCGIELWGVLTPA